MKFMAIILIVFSFFTFAQEKINLTGNLYSDSRILMKDYKPNELPQILYSEGSKKSLFLAGALSAILPGAGEIYSGQYIKGAIFLLIDAAAIYTVVNYNKKGDNQTSYFQKVANESWSVVRYAEWINARFPEANIEINSDENLKPWQRVKWSQINAAEAAYNVGSHKLPPYGDQQYYELIGKYHQFTAGWDDFPVNNNPNYLDPAPAPTSHFKTYSVMRSDANDLYNISSKAVIVIYINHILSAADAVWSASTYNKNLTVGLQLQENSFIYNKELAPVLNIRYSF